MYYYYVWFGVILMLVIGKSSSSNIRYLTCGFMLFLFAAVRGGDIDRDYSGYLNYYNDVLQYNFKNVEPSFIMLAELVNFWFDDPFWLFVIYAALGIFIKLIAIYRIANYKILTLVLYYCSFYLIWEMTQIRAAVAGAIMLLAIVPLAKKRYLSYFILCCAATLFHFTALVMFLIMWTNAVKLNKMRYALLVPVGYLFSLSSIGFTEIALYVPIELVNLKIKSYQIASDLSDSPFNYIFICRCVFGYFLLLYSSYFSRINEFFIVILKLYFLGLFFHVALFAVPGVASRLSEFFLVVEIFLIPMVVGFFKERLVGYILVCTIALLLLISSIQNTHLLGPYHINRSATLDLF